jgi:hypothetical protein
VKKPILGHLSSHDLSLALKIPEPIARVALASISHEVPGAPIVHAQRLQALVGRPSPPAGRDVAQAAVLASRYIKAATS